MCKARTIQKTRRSGDRRGTVHRLFYYGTSQLHLSSEEVWLTPFGFLLDLWECHRQFLGMAKPKRELSIDDIIPPGL